MDKAILRKWLKAGFMEKHALHATEEGTPQGGICSPVLANMALDGLERQLRERYPKATALSRKAKVNLVRYADDFIISGSSKELLEREVKPLVELRVPFELNRQMIDDVERGANDSDWQPAKDAARKLAFAEDRAIFEGYAAAGIVGVRQGTSNPQESLPVDVRKYPQAFAQALSQLRSVGVNGPYSILLSAVAYTELAETSDYGYPVLEHVKRLFEGEIIWTPAIDGAFVLTTRGGDLDLHLGQDASIGYWSHTETQVRLYLQETFTFLYLTSESAVAFGSPKKAHSS